MAGFAEALARSYTARKLLCVGLDTNESRLPDAVRDSPDPQLAFNKAIIDATHDVVAAYKPNSAFYEARGAAGIDTLVQTVAYIRQIAPQTMVVLDAKRGDIGSTNDGYVTFAFDIVDADAVTLHPYLGAEAAAPFLDREDRGVFVLARTSNPGAGEFQDALVQQGPTTAVRPLYQHVALSVQRSWNKRNNCGLVVGATYPAELAELRALAPDLPLLIPGVGTQGGDVKQVADACASIPDAAPVLINSSRDILFASKGADFAAAARERAMQLNRRLSEHWSWPAK